MVDVVLGQPAPAVDIDDDRMRARSFGQRQLSELERLRAIGELLSRRGSGQFVEIRLGQAGLARPGNGHNSIQ